MKASKQVRWIRSCKPTLNRLCIRGLLVHTFGPNTRGLVRPGFALQTGNTWHRFSPPTSTHFCTCARSLFWGQCGSASFAMLPVPVTMTPGFSSLLKTLERQKMSVDSMKRPLMMAALNGLYVARMPVPESPAEDGAKAATDERVRCSLLIYEWSFFMNFYL